MLLDSYGYIIKEEESDDISYIFPNIVNINTTKLSNFAIVYKFVNNELILRMYNRFESKYLNEITKKLLETAEN